MQRSVATNVKPIGVALALGALALAIVLILSRANGPGFANASSHCGGAADQPGPARRQHRPVRVRQPGRPDHGHDHRQLHPARGAGRRAELLQLRRQGPVRDQRRQQRRRRGGSRPTSSGSTRRPGTRTRSSTTPARSARSTDPNWNRPQTYNVTLVDVQEERQAREGHKNGPVQLNSSRSRRRPTTSARVRRRTTTPSRRRRSRACRGGIKVFAGQRDDPFFVDLGSIFDLGGLRPFNPFHLIPLAGRAGRGRGQELQHAHDRDPGSDRAARPGADHRRSASTPARAGRSSSCSQDDGTTDAKGDWVQVSRLGNPLINEVVIPLGQKDFWNRSDPEDDAQFETRYTTPEVAHLENLLYGAPPTGHPAVRSSRSTRPAGPTSSLILLTGVPGLNFTGSTKPTCCG